MIAPAYSFADALRAAGILQNRRSILKLLRNGIAKYREAHGRQTEKLADNSRFHASQNSVVSHEPLQ
jgi:hypothetical protein